MNRAALQRSDARSVWLMRYLRRQQETDIAIRKMLRDAAKDVEAQIGKLGSGLGAQVRAAQLQAALVAINRRISEMWAFIGQRVRASRAAVTADAFRAGFDWDWRILSKYKLDPGQREQLRRGLEVSAARNVEMAVRRLQADEPRLSRQVWKSRDLANNTINKRVNSGIARGLTVHELAKEGKKSVSPNAKGGVSYSALRLARTEINKAYHSAAISASQAKPWVEGLEWRLSSTHFARVGKDICDLLAANNQFKLGKGIYPVGMVPEKPHPNCLCYTVPALPSEEAFVAAFLAGAYDEELGTAS